MDLPGDSVLVGSESGGPGDAQVPRQFIALEVLLERRSLHVDEQAIKAGRVIVDGRVITNPAVDAASWRVVATCESAVTGSRGATEFSVHAQREAAS